MEDNLIFADWIVPKNVRAFTTTRIGGFSKAPFCSWNFSDYVGDEIENVKKNRQKLKEIYNLPSEITWLKQIHSNLVIDLNEISPSLDLQVDGAYSNQQNRVCSVLTADCLPVFICSSNGKEVAIAHAGWRGLLNGVIENALTLFSSPKNELIIWFGPAICEKCFEVGSDVIDLFCTQNPIYAQAFTKISNEKYLANIFLLAKLRLNLHGISQIFGGNLCTKCDESRFFSYRRESKTGRMLSFIWFE